MVLLRMITDDEHDRIVQHVKIEKTEIACAPFIAVDGCSTSFSSVCCLWVS